jgi:hypothetical protein
METVFGLIIMAIILLKKSVGMQVLAGTIMVIGVATTYIFIPQKN